MSKIICDVCGSAYSDTASQCPICGTAKRDTSVKTPENESAENGYSYVKGGRFSKANVRKHNSGKELTRKPAEKPEEPKSNMPPLPVAPKPAKQERPKPVKEERPKPVREERPKTTKEERPAPRKDSESNGRITNIILAVIVLILLALVIYACVYIVQHYYELFPSEDKPSEPSGTHQTVGGIRIPCVGITLPALERLESDGAPQKLDISFTPSNTTDEKSFVSSDPSIADVDEDGVITVYASGEVTITVTCGDESAELPLTCVLVTPTDPTQPSEPTVPDVPEGALKFVNASGKEATDVTFSKYGEEYQLYKGEIEASLVTFTSSDPTIVTIDEAGKIKIVGKGIATVYAEYGNRKIECKIICSNVQVPVETVYELNYTDVTMKVGESLTIRLLDKQTGAPVSGLTWYHSMPGTNYISLKETDTGVKVTGTDVTVGVKGVAYVRVMCDYEGVTYTCIVRVKAKPAEE